MPIEPIKISELTEATELANDDALPIVDDSAATPATKNKRTKLSTLKAWINALTNPMTTAGDLIVGGVDGAPARLAKGADGQILKMVAGAIAWAAEATGLTNPMTTAGDLIVGGVDGAADRLAKGTDGQVLKVVGSAIAWATDETGGGGTNTLYAERSYFGTSNVETGTQLFMVARTAMTISRVDAEVQSGNAPSFQLYKNGVTLMSDLTIDGDGNGNTLYKSEPVSFSLVAGDKLEVQITNNGEYMASGAAVGPLMIGIEFARA
jgi:hypothetical protein